MDAVVVDLPLNVRNRVSFGSAVVIDPVVAGGKDAES
jgi:hypothetical protein